MFLSAVWTLILTAPIHYRGTIGEKNDGMLHFYKSDEETNSSTSWMAWGWVDFQKLSFLSEQFLDFIYLFIHFLKPCVRQGYFELFL